MANISIALSLLKGDLGFFGTDIDEDVDEYLNQKVESAKSELSTICRLNLDENDVWDADLIAMYAAWLYRKRDSGEGKPPMLQSAIRNRQVRRDESRLDGGQYMIYDTPIQILQLPDDVGTPFRASWSVFSPVTVQR